jgi:hypothetical protein
MSDEFAYLDEEDEAPRLDPNIRKQLREKEKLSKELEAVRAELELTRREALFGEVGIPKSGAGALVRKAYDGPADAESVRRFAQEYGVLDAPAPQVEKADSSEQELAQLRKAQAATLGTSGAFPDVEQNFLARLSEAHSADEVMKIIMSDDGRKLGLHSVNEGL